MLNILLSLFFISFVMFVVYFVDTLNIRVHSYFFFSLNVVICLSLFMVFNKQSIWFQNISIFHQTSYNKYIYMLGLDALSVLLLLMVSIVIFLCYTISYNIKYNIRLYSLLFFFTLVMLYNVFLTLDIFFFYIFYEAIIIPMFLLIIVWGSRSRKIYAAFQFFIYTLLGSIFLLVVFVGYYFNYGTSNMHLIANTGVYNCKYLYYWIFLFIGFSVKIPIMPFHLWLPEAHVEAPTTGSVILAAILLKLGLYAMLRFLILPTNVYFLDYLFFVLIISYLGFNYASLVALAQIDIKKMIAYSSVAHMNMALIGLVSVEVVGLSGIYYIIFSHAITSTALFIGIGTMYDRYKTRLLYYYGGLINIMPLFGIFYFIYILSNLSFPGTCNFISEFFLITGGFFISNTVIFFCFLGLLLSVIYSMFVFTRVFFGPLNIYFIRYYNDLRRRDFYVMFILAFFVLLFGMNNYIVDFLHNVIFISIN